LLVAGGILPAQTHDWKIVPGERVGPLTPKSDLADIKRLFGAANVVEQPVQVGEGFEEPGVVIYKGTPSRTLAVVWREVETPPKPHTVHVCYGQEPGRPCEWKTPEGITLGTSLSQLEKLNRRPFSLAGFAWDYGGTVMGWNDGRLETSLNNGGRLILRLEPADANMPEYRQVLGDRTFSSSHPAMLKLNPRVYDIVVVFADQPQ
jgi:hypothetical protein